MRNLFNQYNVFLIFNEIQTGIGRTEKLFCYENYGIEPDILTLAKSLGAGFPISSMLTTNKIASIIKPGIHGTTYKRNPLAYMVAESVINIINTKKVLYKVKKISKDIFYAKCY